MMEKYNCWKKIIIKKSLTLLWELQQKIVIVFRGVFRTQSNIYDGAILKKYLKAKSLYLFPKKASSTGI